MPPSTAEQDTAANISAAFDGLSGNAQVSAIVVSDSATHEVSVTVAQLTSDAAGLAELFQANGTTPATVTVTDTAANISAAIATLDSSAQVNAIVISDNAPLVLNAGQVVADPTALGGDHQPERHAIHHHRQRRLRLDFTLPRRASRPTAM